MTQIPGSSGPISSRSNRIRIFILAFLGKPSEKNLYADIEAAWHALRTRMGVSPENIILYGQSIGTVPTVDLASRFEVNINGFVVFVELMSEKLSIAIFFLESLVDIFYIIDRKL